jgi:hypothetical protein
MSGERVRHARVEVDEIEGDAPVTLADWLAWREAQNERMRREVLAQVEAWLVEQMGGTTH